MRNPSLSWIIPLLTTAIAAESMDGLGGAGAERTAGPRELARTHRGSNAAGALMIYPGALGTSMVCVADGHWFHWP